MRVQPPPEFAVSTLPDQLLPLATIFIFKILRCSLRSRLRKVLKSCKMLDWCTRPRMLLLGGLLLVCSLFILFFGEYVEENLGTNKFIRRQSVTELPHQKASDRSQVCPPIGDGSNKNGTAAEPILLQSCQKCSEFERNALQVGHCHPTGYFDVYSCPGSGNSTGNSTIYRPCHSHTETGERNSFYLFSLGSFACTVTFWTLIRWRKETQERRAFAYQRLGNAG